MEYDILIEGGRVIDGTGNPWFRAEVGVVGDHVEAIGRLSSPEAYRRVNAEGLVVSPGFIDIHSHSDFTILLDRKVESKVRQGVTTEVIGNCGTSAAPMNQAVKEYREKYMRAELGENFQFNWETMDDYLPLIDEEGSSFNVVALVGHGTVRQNILGFKNKPPSQGELEDMRGLVEEAMIAGAWGISTGLIYAPGCYAETIEIIELAKVVAEHGGIYASHIRGEGESLMQSVKEALEVGEEAGIPVEISHFKAFGRDCWGRTKDSLRLVEEGRKRGLDVTIDQYPYTASSTSLLAYLPHWVHEEGTGQLLDRLKDPEIRQRIAEDPAVLSLDWCSVMIVLSPGHSQYQGMRITDVADLEGKVPIEAVLDLLLEEEAQVRIVSFSMWEEDVLRVMQSPFMMVGSDGRAVAPRGVLGRGKPHPRYYGTFPRVLGHYVRKGTLTLQGAVRKMTSLPAQRLGLGERGILREGFKADITVFNPRRIRDESTFSSPHRFASGIPYVIVNGKIVIDRGDHTGALSGRALRKTDKTD